MIQRIFLVSIVSIATVGLEAKPLPQDPATAERMKIQSDSEEAAIKQKLEKSAKGGDPVAMYRFAKRGQPETMKMEWLNKAATKGYGPAVLDLSAKIEPNPLDKKLTSAEIGQKYKEYQYAMADAYKALVVWAEKGDLESMFRIGTASGVFAKEGIATEHECLPWLRKAADLGHDVAPFEMALKLIRIGTPTEKAEGFEWLKKSTKNGACRYQAAVELARYYSYGFPEIGLKRNANKAWKWIKKGAELQGADAIENFMEENGLQNPDEVRPGEILFQ